MPPFSLLIKPVSADCNMNCMYCFYLPKKELYSESKSHIMRPEILDHVISSYLKTEQKQYIFGWQGGEPSLAGLEFFKKITNMQLKYGKTGTIISNAIQTNATLINDAFSRHFFDYKYLVGVSIDGPEYLHNQNRKFINGEGSFKRVMKSIEALRRNNVEFNILTLVSSSNVEKTGEIYDFLKSNEFYFNQYIPCVEYNADQTLKTFSINGTAWGKFLIALFDKWYPDDIFKVSIRFFDSIMNVLLSGNAASCNIMNNCSQYFLIEHNGDIYPCDFFVEKKWKLGNIMTDSWDKILDSKKMKEFSMLKSKYNKQCLQCEYLKFCYGDCLKYRSSLAQGSHAISTLCSGLKMFYEHSLSVFKKIANQIRNMQ
jgi:uncharacterized protein